LNEYIYHSGRSFKYGLRRLGDRILRGDGDLSNPADEESKPESTSDKEEEKGGEGGDEKTAAVDISALDTYTTLKLFLSILAGQTWRKMGLVVDPQTNKVEKDMDQARVAIDCFQLILKRIEGNLTEDEKKKLTGLLSDLQLNFVSHQ
jgi:hypothetical protein